MSNTLLVILPGWGGSKKTWADFSVLANEKFSFVEVIELPCFGNEPCPNDVWGVEDYADFVHKKIKALKEKHPHKKILLLGHSFGGQVASFLVSQNSSICDTLVLSGAAVYRPKKTLKRVILSKIAAFGKAFFSFGPLKKYSSLSQKVLYKLIGSPDYNNTEGIKRHIFQKVIRQDMMHVLPNITVPTIVISGTKDTYVPKSHSKKISRQIPNAIFEVIKHGTHGLHISKKQALLQILLKENL